MESVKPSPLTYLRRLQKFDLQPGIVAIGAVGVILTNGIILYVTWPIDGIAKVILMVICGLLTVNLITAQRNYRRKQASQSSAISITLMTALSITFTYVVPRAGHALLLMPLSLLVGLLSILDRRGLIIAIILTGTTMIIISIIAAVGNFAPPPTMQGDVAFTLGGVLIGGFVLFAMLSRYHGYMTKMVEELQERNEQLHHAHDNLETQVLARTADLERQSQSLREEIAQRKVIEETLARRNRELDMFNAITLGLINKYNPNDLFDEIVLRTCDLLRTTHASILMIDPQTNTLRARYSSGEHKHLIRKTFAMGEGLAGRVWESGETMRIDDYHAWSGQAVVNRAVNLGPLAGTPVRSDSRIMGVIITWRGVGDTPFTDDDVLLLKRLGQLASAVHDNAQLMQTQRDNAKELTQRVQARTQELSTLLNVANKLPATAGLDAMLTMVFDQLSELVHIDSAAIFYRHNQRSKAGLQTLYYRGPERDHIEGVSTWPISDSFLEVAERRQPVIIPDVHADTPLARKFQQISQVVFGDGQVSPHITSWMGVPMMLKGQVMGILTLDNSQPNYFTEAHAELAMGIAQQAALAIENAQLQEQALQNAVQKAAQTERSRLARELHDSVSQAVFSIGLHARAMEQLFAINTGKAQEHLVYVLNLAEAALAEIRALIFELRPESLEHEGILAALNKQVTALRARHNLRINLDVFRNEPDIPIDVKEAIYRVSLEAIHNVVKHAHATTVDVHLAQQGQLINLEIRDDGVGFDPASVPSGHFGLQTMRERIDQLDGQIDVSSNPGTGTRVTLSIPLDEATEAIAS